VEWITYGNPNLPFSDVKILDLFDHRFIKVENIAIFWLIGPDTVSVKVLSPLDTNHWPIIKLDGVDLRTGEMEDKELWKYRELVPEISALYKEEDY